MQIPKRIIQTGKHAELPLRTRAIVSNIKLLNPDFEYLFFDDQQVQSFMRQEFPQYCAIFDSFAFPIQRYDFFRYLAVYRYGGFYFDLDVLLARGLASLLPCGCVFSFDALLPIHFMREQYGMDWEMGNYAFGATPRHAFLEAVIANCVKAQKDRNWVKPMMRGLPPFFRHVFLILYTTGPWLVSRTFAENKELAKQVTVLFPEDVCDFRTWNCFGDFGVHLGDSSWRSRRGSLRGRLVNYWETWSVKRLAKQLSRSPNKVRKPESGEPKVAT